MTKKNLQIRDLNSVKSKRLSSISSFLSPIHVLFYILRKLEHPSLNSIGGWAKITNQVIRKEVFTPGKHKSLIEAPIKIMFTN